MIVLHVLFLLLAINFARSQQSCVSRDYGYGGTVCVCNATYCDTLPPLQRSNSNIQVFTSNNAGLRLQLSQTNFGATNSSITQLHVNPLIEYQQIIGFGGAFTDATGININSLPPQMRETLLQAYFSENGLQYNLGRVPIGGTDFSVRPYSYDDGPTDVNLTRFSLQPEDFIYKIPLIRKAYNLTNGNLQLFGSAWTAPRWLKTNGLYSGFGFIRRYFYQVWANYFVRFLQAYQSQGINFWAITTGNEPADVVNPFDRLEVVGWPSTLLETFIANYLGPTIQNSNVSNVKIMAMDDQRIFLPWYIQRIFRNPITRRFVDGIAVHWYLDEYVPERVLTETHNLFPEKFILATEACNMPSGEDPAVMLGSWYRGEKYSFDILQDLNNWVTGWVDWNMALNPQGGPNYIQNYVDSPIIINSTSGEFYKQPMYYHLAHFTKFLPRGSTRIASFLNDTLLNSVAFRRPDGGRTVIILNTNANEIPLQISENGRGSTSLILSPQSITTVVYS